VSGSGIAATVIHHAETSPRSPAVQAPRRSWSYGDLADAVRALASRLRSLAGPGQPIAIAMANEGEAVAGLLAAELNENPALLLGAGFRPEELRWALGLSGARAIVAPPGIPRDPGLSAIMAEHGSSDAKSIVVSALAPAANADWGGDAFFCQMTSGSTGPSRPAVRKHVGVLREVEAVTARLGLSNVDRVLCASSIGHSYALVGGVLASLWAGASVRLQAHARDVAWAGDGYRPSVVFGLAITYEALLGDARAKGAPSPPPPLPPPAGEGSPVADARWILSAGAPLPEGLFSRFVERFGKPIRQDYGTTETGTIAIDETIDVREGIAGAPLEYMEVSISGSGSEGEILVRSSAVSSGYLTEHGLEDCRDADGWYHTGDIGTVERGQLRLASRLISPILVGEQAIDPGAVERLLMTLPGVKDTAVVPTLDGSGHTALKAVVVAETLDREEIEVGLRARLPASHVPAEIELRAELPRSPAGKVLRKYLG
jgi:long-chain acyl-CoA synthetase